MIVRLTYLVLFTVGVFCTPHIFSQEIIYLEIKTDSKPTEISWTLTDENGTVLYDDSGSMTEPDKVYSWGLEVADNQCVRFDIYDTGGDGIDESGHYAMRRNFFWYANFLNDFGSSNYHIMGDCDQGLTCEQPMPVTAKLMNQPAVENYWYSILSDRDVYYDMNTCFNAGVVSRMYIYETCPSMISSGPEGTIAYSEQTSSCIAGSGFRFFYMRKDIEYLVRVEILDAVGYENIAIEFDAKAENRGCTDPLSCNYNPLANLDDGTCEYDDSCRPDLVISREHFESSIFLDKYNLEDTCLLSEACVTGLGQRDIVRFTTAIYNIGTADYVVGYPEENSDAFSNDNCHEHWHHLGYAEYLLYAGAGDLEPIGFKNGFCVQDSDCPDGETKYNCQYMGITAGCFDEYRASIDCQWIDVTDVPDGDYTMVARINWGRYRDARGKEESDYENNWTQVCINLDRSSGELLLTKIDSCDAYRDCLGVAYGAATLDCAGVCGGLSHFGDFDSDGEISDADLDAYLEGIEKDYDASTEWHNHCLFPAGIENVELEASLSLYEADVIEQSVTIAYQSADTELKAFQFSIAGIDKITEVINVSGMDFQVYRSPANSVFGLEKGSGLIRSDVEQPLVKIFYDNQIADEICLSEIQDIVTPSYQKILGTIVEPACFFYSSIDKSSEDYDVHIYPNPAKAKLTIDAGNDLVTHIELLSLSGKVIYQDTFVDKLELATADYGSGVYLLKAVSGQSIHMQKIVIE